MRTWKLLSVWTDLAILQSDDGTVMTGYRGVES